MSDREDGIGDGARQVARLEAILLTLDAEVAGLWRDVDALRAECGRYREALGEVRQMAEKWFRETGYQNAREIAARAQAGLAGQGEVAGG